METPEDLNIYSILLVGTIGMLVLILGLVLFVFMHRKKVAAQELQLEKTKLLHQQELLQKNIQTQEEERQRIARDLHDEVGAMLSTLRLYMATTPGQQETTSLQRRKDMIDQIITRVRGISHELLPPGLELFGLQKTMEDLCLSYKPLPGIEVHFHSSDTPIDCAYDISLALFRILQELLHNTMKHAGADQVDVRLLIDNNKLHFSYHDNGRGFDPIGFSSGLGLGLGSIESRARMVGGELLMDTAPGKGFALTLNIPMQWASTGSLNATLNQVYENTH